MLLAFLQFVIPDLFMPQLTHFQMTKLLLTHSKTFTSAISFFKGIAAILLAVWNFVENIIDDLLEKQNQQAFFVRRLSLDAENKINDWTNNLDNPNVLFSDSEPKSSLKKLTLRINIFRILNLQYDQGKIVFIFFKRKKSFFVTVKGRIKS